MYVEVVIPGKQKSALESRGLAPGRTVQLSLPSSSPSPTLSWRSPSACWASCIKRGPIFSFAQWAPMGLSGVQNRDRDVFGVEEVRKQS